jgi:hypothetical protein
LTTILAKQVRIAGDLVSGEDQGLGLISSLEKVEDLYDWEEECWLMSTNT